MFFTTSRRAGKGCKRLAAALANLFPFGKSINRGEKKIEGLVGLAREKGKSRICVIFEQNGKPVKLSFISVSEGNWEWLKPEIYIREWVAGKKLDDEICEVKITGTKGEAFGKLVDSKLLNEIAGNGAGEIISFSASGRMLKAKIGAKAVFSARVAWL